MAGKQGRGDSIKQISRQSPMDIMQCIVTTHFTAHTGFKYELFFLC